MNCKCGGNPIRIAVDCYQCGSCGKKQAIGFLALDNKKQRTPMITTNNAMRTIININPNIDMQEHLKKVEEKITKALKIPGIYFKR